MSTVETTTRLMTAEEFCDWVQRPENANRWFELVRGEVIELPAHPFFIASQFHPEFRSKPHQPHPLFKGFIAAAHGQIHQKPL